MKDDSTIEGIIRQNTDNPLPIIRIVSEEDEAHTKLVLEMEPETRDMLIKWGKIEATDDQFAEIGFIKALEDTIKDMESRDAE